ncbi:hypothetical protein ACFW04_011545 [Cataglyphis niger]
MHVVCLGVVKKILSAWKICGQCSHLSKLSRRFIFIMSSRLNNLKEYCPSQYALDLSICVQNIKQQNFINFCFIQDQLQLLNFAEPALQKFILRNDFLYGATFNTYNIHRLLHITDNMRRFSDLVSFSAFSYENNRSIFRKYCRKPGLPLQQFFKRMKEIEIHGKVGIRIIDSSIYVSALYNNDSNYLRDNCCILRNESICIVCNIILDNNFYRLAVKKFLQVEDFYNIVKYFNLDEVYAKYYRIPFWNSTSMDDSDSNEENHSSQYIVADTIMVLLFA